MNYRCYQKLKCPCAYQNLIYFMTLSGICFQIYASLEKDPTVKMKGVISKIPVYHSGAKNV